MSEPQAGANGTAVPSASQTAPPQPAAAPQQSAAQPPAPAPTQPEQANAGELRLTTDQLNERLARAKAAYAKQLGLSGEPEQDAARLAKLAELERSQLTEAERVQVELAKLATVTAERDQLASAVQIRATHEMAGLTETQRAAVTAIAGDNPAAQLNAITALAPTWAAQNSAAPAAPAPTPAVAPPTTTVAPPASPGAPVPSTTSHLATHRSLLASNPIHAAHYYERHYEAIKAEENQSRGS